MPFFAALGLVSFVFRLMIDILGFPFRILQRTAQRYPLRVARVVIGVFTATLLVYLFDLPYVIQISFSGGLIALIAGEVI